MKRFSLWFAVAVVLFSFQGGFSRPTKSQLDSLEALQPALYNFQNEIQYDNVESYPGELIEDTVGDYWMAVRFTPTQSSFTLQGIKFQVANPLINYSDGCSVFVARDTIISLIHTPGYTIFKDTIGAPLSNRMQSHLFDTIFEFGRGVSFWILMGPVPSRPDNDEIGNGWWGFLASSPLDTPQVRSYIRFKNSTTWVEITYGTNPNKGNWVIRAGGKYSDPPDVVINEVMFNPDISSSDSARNHVWIELFNSGEIQTAQNWKLINGSNTPLQLPPFSLPSRKYLVVHLVNKDTMDLDFSDDRGDIYLNYPFQFFAKDKDACVLVTPDFQPSERSMLGWNLKNLRFGSSDTIPNPGSQTTPENPFLNRNVFKVARIQPRGAVGPILSIAPGISVGRDSSSSDTSFTFETPSGTDYKGVTFLGGPNSAGSTMGKKNFLAMEFDTVVADTIQQAGSWMIMLYIAGDYGDSLRTPDRWYFDVLNQVERVMPQSQPRNVNVAVLYDTRRGKVGGQSVSQAGATFRGTLKFDDTGRVKNLELVSPSLNTGLPTTLSHFVAWAKDSSLQSGPGQSSDHYVLALKGDGAGWQGLCGDEGDESRLEIGELRSALATGLGGDTLDLIIFDSPLMGQIEVAAQVQGFAKYMVASPEMINVGDFDYARLVNKLAGQPSISSEDLAKFAVDSVLAGGLAGDNYSIWTAIRLDNLPTLVRWVDTLAQKLRVSVENPCARQDSSDNFQLKLRDQVLTNFNVNHYGLQAQGMADFIDLKNFAERAKVLSSCASTHVTAADNVDNLLQSGGSIIVSRFAGTSTNLHNISGRRAGGLSVYFPSSRQRPVPIKRKGFFNYYRDSIDHPFENTGLVTEGGEFDTLRVYAADAEICYPHTGTACSPILNDTLPGNSPHRPAPNFVFVDSTRWDELLIRYYKPVADAGSLIYGSKNINEPVDLNARGSSDPDSDSLQYFWDPFDNSDNPDSCNSYSHEDMDKNCSDAMDDDSLLAGPAPTLSNGFPSPRVFTITLNVWDDNDIAKPYNLRRFQTSKSTSSITINAPVGYLVQEDEFSGLLTPNFYRTRLEATGIVVSGPRNLPECGDRENPGLVNDIATIENPIFWQTGRDDSCLFRGISENLLRTRLDDISRPRGAWIFAPRLGVDPDYYPNPPNDSLREFFRTYFGLDTARSIAQVCTLLFSAIPIDSVPVFQGLNALFPCSLRVGSDPLAAHLEPLVINFQSANLYPLLKDENGNIVAIAAIRDFGGGVKRGRIFSSFGLEHILPTNYNKLDTLLDKLVNWLFDPTPRIVQPVVRQRGDLNNSGGNPTPADVVLLLNCVFIDSNGPACDLPYANMNCNVTPPLLTPSDVVLLLEKAFNNDPPGPLSPCP